MAIQLKRAGVHDFVILEKADDVGGTWRDNTYPGCACDVQSDLYSFSFRLNPSWSRTYSEQQEIWDYLRDCADEYGLRQHIRFGTEVTGAEFDEEAGHWRVATGDGETITASAVVLGVGSLHWPKVPDIPGVDRFKGTAFHSAQWDHDYDLAGKRVAVIGTGASAIQFVPRIAAQVASLHVFQRTPPWIIPKPDRAVSPREQRIHRQFPVTQRLRRSAIYWQLESRALGFMNPKLMKAVEGVAKRHICRQLTDPHLRTAVTPDYTMGCKRILPSNDYYPALNRPNVELLADGIAQVREHSIVTRSGREVEIDAMIFGTGFHVTDGYRHLDVVGRGGLKMQDAWRSGPETYLGITVTGFPNLFFLLGPNTGLGHNSVVFMIESQLRYVMQCLRPLLAGRASAVEVRPSAQEAFNWDIQQQLRGAVWNAGGCHSWYLDENGVNRTLWPGFSWRYWLRTRRVRTEDYHVVPR
jgi:cation diffusion facilitator CzcD-associated flavoprotein CzcO